MAIKIKTTPNQPIKPEGINTMIAHTFLCNDFNDDIPQYKTHRPQNAEWILWAEAISAGKK